MLLLFVCKISAQNKLVTDSISFKNIIKEMPSFTIYGDNYLITGSTLGKTPDSDNSDAKFQIGFKQRLTNSALPWNTYAFFTYRQIAFWDIYKESVPFREINYNPGFAIMKPFFKNSRLNEILMFQFEHQSNGRDLENSRSWNYVSLSYMRFLSDRLTGKIKVWLPVGNLDGNSDITDYRGFQQLELDYKLNNSFIFESEFRKAYSLDWKGSMLLGLNFRISKTSNQYIYLQYFLGYSEDLINYNQDTQRLRVGIAFKDLFIKFRK
ncbi:phospholipase A [Flavobacterium arcticum]|nr:phospholipase A [Flavobacterium arcticum]KAF2509732.1 phospholipase A [Flavobacterium arcticum]